jgi:GxxExxY protein
MHQMAPNEFDPRTYAIIGAAQEVHRILGCGYLERVYHLAMINELRRRNIPFAVEVVLPVSYKGDLLDCTYRIDLLCFGEVLVELKALGQLSSLEEAQVLNYLRLSTLEVALLLNFGAERLQARRFSSAARLATSVASGASVDGQAPE